MWLSWIKDQIREDYSESMGLQMAQEEGDCLWEAVCQEDHAFPCQFRYCLFRSIPRANTGDWGRGQYDLKVVNSKYLPSGCCCWWSLIIVDAGSSRFRVR